MQDLLSLLVCSNEKTGLQVGIWYKIIFWHELCVRRCLILHVFLWLTRGISVEIFMFSSQVNKWCGNNLKKLKIKTELEQSAKV